MYRKHHFNVSTDTGTWGDTGPQLWGKIAQMRWAGSNYDTGGDLALSLIPHDSTDTGNGWLFYNNNDCLGSDFTCFPSQAVVDHLGLDTGPDARMPIVAAGEHLRVKVTPGDTGDVAGTLTVWMKIEA